MSAEKPQILTFRNSVVEFPVFAWQVEEGGVGLRSASRFSYPEIPDNCLSESDFDKALKTIEQQIADKERGWR